jgi:hypothetical protein
MLSDQDVCPLCLMSIHQPVYDSDGTGAVFSPQQQDQPQEAPKPAGHRALWISLLVSIVDLRTDYISRISHPEPGMPAKQYFQDLKNSFNEHVSEIIDNISNMN